MSTFKSYSSSSPSLTAQNFNGHPTEEAFQSLPTGGEYIGQFTKDFLSVVDAIAQAVPVPGFGPVVKVALKIVEACDKNQASLERAEELKNRIKIVVSVFVNELKGKKIEEIPAKLIKDIDTLNKDMVFIKKTLDKIASQNRLLLVFFRNINDGKINECVMKLNNSLEGFNLARSIDHTKMLARLEEQIRAFSLDKIQITMDKVDTIFNEQFSRTTLPSRAPIPANSTIFYGRDSLVTELVHIVTGPSRRHICLLGPGGMGKTSLSLAVMGHPDVKARFADHLRVWVPCVKATSVSLFLDTLHSSLAIPRKGGDIRGEILSTLRTSAPIVILLDNLETPWNTIGGQSEVERFLRDIHQIPHVVLFVTMRSSTPPCDDIPWYHIDVQSVDAAAAREIYISRHPQGREDPGLPKLLELIGNMPLAITLLAKVARMTGISAEKLAQEYNKLGTPIMGQGLDSETNMDICIGLSVDSPRMKDQPEAWNLLCIISMLPTGTSYEMLSNWWAKTIFNLMGALNILKNTSLIEERNSTYFVLPVIQRYVLDPSHFNVEVRAAMIQSACMFLKHHESKVGDSSYKERSAALSAEEGNLGSVLLQATEADHHIIRDGFLSLIRHQRFHRPRVDVVEHALQLLRTNNITVHDTLLQVDLLCCYADILSQLNQLDKALQQEKQTLEFCLSESVADKKAIPECPLGIENESDNHRDGNFDLDERLIKEGQAESGFFGDEVALGRCLHHLGPPSSALDLLARAESILAKVKSDKFRHAECTRFLGRAYYYRTGQYDLAFLWVKSSYEEHESLGDLVGCWMAAQTLGRIRCARGDYKACLEHLFQSLEVRKSMGLRPTGVSLEGMGLAWAKLEKTSDARRALEEALQLYLLESTNNFSSGIIRTRFFLKRLEDPELNPSPEEITALTCWYTWNHLVKLLKLDPELIHTT